MQVNQSAPTVQVGLDTSGGGGGSGSGSSDPEDAVSFNIYFNDIQEIDADGSINTLLPCSITFD